MRIISDLLQPVKRKIHFLVPPHFTNYGTRAEKVLDLGVFNLEVILPVSSTSALH